ncbi:MAG: ABC transporter ATP-binding protein [Firmicutes bacterium]|nr:ABC transporter ATP-binding protein [Candidatus Colimorpha enterica]
MIKVENVSKIYKLGQIGGTTLRDELQRFGASIRHKEDPTKIIGADQHTANKTFKALDGISFEVRRGERVGIIGHNGAGKSTLLKLISRVTGPTDGEIGLNGRVASMLEVGTGFHAELTGRENVYMNGAILGMTKKEIDSKIEDIIEFSECRQFIDTPVKRYSSGMYVKLAFSVAAHLDSEIMIMDEVLAVGDLAFQKKCLDKMNEVSRSANRTILYVSHNMRTIRELCNRVIVLDHGRIIFDGDVEEGINIYADVGLDSSRTKYDLSEQRREDSLKGIDARIMGIELLGKKRAVYEVNEDLPFSITVKAKRAVDNLSLRLELRTADECFVGTSKIFDFGSIGEGETKTFDLAASFRGLVMGNYQVLVVLYESNREGTYIIDLDLVKTAFVFETVDSENILGINWNRNTWGNISFDDIRHLDREKEIK